MTTSNFVETLDSSVKLLWKDAIAINSTAFEAEDNGKQVFVGSQTKTALLDFARDNLSMDRISTERSNVEIAQIFPFGSSRKCIAIVIKLKDSKTYRLVVKGCSEIMLRYCSSIVRDATHSIDAVPLSGEGRETLEHLIDAYAGRSLRTIGFIFRDFESDVWPPKALKPLHAIAMKSRPGLNRKGLGVKRVEDDKTQAEFTDICKQMTFLGIVGVQDPPRRKDVPKAVVGCITASVFPRMVTGDNIITAKAIAIECGIYTESGMHETQADQSHLSPERWQASIALRAPADPVAPGYLNGRFLEDAFVDTCAGNFITEEYLNSHGIGHHSESTRTIVRADGSTFSTLGTVCLFWKFKGELDSHRVDFDVLASEYCNHAITLGGKFLSATKTLTRFAHRIVRRLRNTIVPRVFFQGGG
ncbi:hypothetical protein TI39_contig4134g00040 [Zymoseptoria brevis]|uniref:Uncharacterized protein n=1 Tax=Zymoseptoria brevis TaxID=1047168 RepID=A0A0F4GFY5_9PEZI|nr:hypothetical protein TI39_contig4134g00040 [Zymoseptoria brevis]